MTSPAFKPRGLYFEDFSIGQQIVSAGRTITESDVVAFAGLSGDYNSMHIDEQYSSKTPFQHRVAHGLLGMAIASGLAMQTGVMEGTVMAFREVNEWKFIKPIYLGDTVHVVMEVKECKAMPRIGGGLVSILLDLKNQKDETTMKGTWVVLMASRPSAS